VGEGMLRAGDRGGSAVLARLLSHAGGFCEALLIVDCRRFACDGVVGVLSFGFSGELLGVKGRTVVDGEASRIDPGLRNGDWRGLLEKSGEGLYGVGVVDCCVLVAWTACVGETAYHGVTFSRVRWVVVLQSSVWAVLMTAPVPATRTQRFLQIALSYRASVPPRIRRLVRAAPHRIASQ
jgi:hypothetical protein